MISQTEDMTYSLHASKTQPLINASTKTLDAFVPSGLWAALLWGSQYQGLRCQLACSVFARWPHIFMQANAKRESNFGQIFCSASVVKAKIALVSCFASILTIWPSASAWKEPAENRIFIKEQLIQTFLTNSNCLVYVWHWFQFDAMDILTGTHWHWHSSA